MKIIQKAKRVRRSLTPSVILGAILLCLLASGVRPQGKLELPKPNGSYHVGTFSSFLTDTLRPELGSQTRKERTVAVQMWYPAEKPDFGHRLASYFPEANKFADAIDGELLETLKAAKTNSFLNGAISKRKAKYPTVLFSGGFGMSRHYYTGLFEELASHGYIAVAIDLPYLNLMISDRGEVLLPQGGYWDSFPATKGIGSKEKGQQLLQAAFDYLSADHLFVLEILGKLNLAGDLRNLRGRFDTRKVASIGHSAGSLAVQGLLWKETPFKAFVLYDITLDRKAAAPDVTIVPKGNVTRPILLVRLEYASTPLKGFLDSAGTNFTEVSIDGAKHGSVSDLLLLNSLRRSTGANNQQVLEHRRRIFSETISFLDRRLGGK